jgi:nucleoid-associated protein YgaU
MFAPNSRYASIETASLKAPDGREIAYKRRRFLPRGSDLPKLADATVAPGDRIDLIAARTLGDSEQFWRICDAADALDPADLVEPGRTLTIPMPQP